jgi:hypothetical protein
MWLRQDMKAVRSKTRLSEARQGGQKHSWPFGCRSNYADGTAEAEGSLLPVDLPELLTG